jgi:ABC-type multidrug transport system permease subunit
MLKYSYYPSPRTTSPQGKNDLSLIWREKRKKPSNFLIYGTLTSINFYVCWNVLYVYFFSECAYIGVDVFRDTVILYISVCMCECVCM